MKHGPNLIWLHAARLLRRISLISLIGLISPVCCAADIPALIEQLAAPKVRLRDEAQTALAELPESKAALEKAAASHPSAEARLRAKNLLRDFRDKQWVPSAEAKVSAKPAGSLTQLRRITASPDGTVIAGVYRGGVELYDANMNYLRTLNAVPKPAGNMEGILHTLAFSPDGKSIAHTNHTGQIFVESLEGVILRTLPAETKKVKFQTVTSGSSLTDPFGTGQRVTVSERDQPQEPYGVAFLPDGSGLAVFTGAGLTVHDFKGGERRLLPLADIFPVSGYTVAPRRFALSPDGIAAGLGVEVMGSKDMAALVTLADLKVTARWKFMAIPSSIAVKQGGGEAVVGLREGGVFRCVPGEEWGQSFCRGSAWISGVAYAADGQSVFFSQVSPSQPLVQVAYPSGEVLWSAPATAEGFESLACAGPDRVITGSKDCVITTWDRRSTKPAAGNEPPR